VECKEKGSDGFRLGPKPTENGVKPVLLRLPHRSMTALLKTSQRRKMHKLLLSQALIAMQNKLIKLKENKSKPQVNYSL